MSCLRKRYWCNRKQNFCEIMKIFFSIFRSNFVSFISLENSTKGHLKSVFFFNIYRSKEQNPENFG